MKKLLKNESGMIMVAVVAFIIIMSIVLVGILSRNITQAVTAEGQVKRIYSEQIQKGAFWKAQAQLTHPSDSGVSDCTALTTARGFTDPEELSMANIHFWVDYKCRVDAGIYVVDVDVY